MLIKKITHGFVVQVFDSEKNQFVSQEFVAGDDCEYEDENGVPVMGGKEQDAYLPFDMVQPSVSV